MSSRTPQGGDPGRSKANTPSSRTLLQQRAGSRVRTRPGAHPSPAQSRCDFREGQIGWFADVRSDRPADEITALVQRSVRGLKFGTETLDISVTRPGGKDGVGVKVV